jgi:pSer/pThr/pTyr-binding forkhead associated (FHA) protein
MTNDKKSPRLVLRYIGHTVRPASWPHVPQVDDALENLAPGREYEIPAQGIVIGRYAAADIEVYSPHLKGKHARLWPVDDGIAVEDLGSTNGTAINGVVFSGGGKPNRAIIRPGDRLTLASTHDFEVVEREAMGS